MATNPEDEKRDKILRYLFERHKATRGINKIPIGIRDLHSEMKKRYRMGQAEVSSNLDYLIQVDWVREVVKARSFRTKAGMEVSQEQKKYKISDIGITCIESGTIFKKPQSSSHVNITNIQGVTILGDGNIVNTEYTNLSRALDELDHTVAECNELNDEQKLDIAGDISTIRTQIAKKHPDKTVIRVAWESLRAVATVGGMINAVTKVYTFISGIIK